MSIEPLEGRMLLAADWGDAPAPYATTIAENGARHDASGAQLGALRDMEIDGIHSAAADADGGDDDGVAMGPLRVGQLGAQALVTVQNATPSAKLDAWIDFNGDGSWGGPGEQIANNLTVGNGQNAVTFDVPSTAISGTVIARFRLSANGNLSFKGAAPLADGGEVEDYAVAVSRPESTSAQFTAKQPVAAAVQQFHSIVAADIDGDGDMDLASASENDDTIAWYENDGNQVFMTRTIATDADGARSVFAVDLDGDGDMDVVSGSLNDGKIAWYENNGSQVFMPHTISTSAPSAKNVFAADVDGDGDIDVLSAHGSRTAWYENNGSQVFTQRLLPNAALGVFGLAAADVDGDGDMDVLWSSSSENEVGWYENNGMQTFTAHPITSAAGGARNITTADVDGDGDLDILSASSTDNRIAWYDNDGNQNFTQRTITTSASSAWGVFAADVDGDGDVDVLSASVNDDQINLYVNNGSEVFTPRILSSVANSARSVVAADLDGDGDLDIASASSADTIAWIENRPGDYDNDVDVDGGDFLVWQRGFGGPASPAGSGADGNANGMVDATDLALWQSGFGFATAAATPTGTAAATAAPDAGDSLPAMWFVTSDLFAQPEAGDSAMLVAEPVSGPISETARDAALESPDLLASPRHASHRSGANNDATVAGELVLDLGADWPDLSDAAM